MAREIEIPTAACFKPLLAPSRYKGAYGGRGSGKSHFFAGLMIEQAMLTPGFRGLCVREVQKSLDQSAKLLIEDKISAFGVGDAFDIQDKRIITPGGGLIIFAGMQDHTAESIKSYEGFNAAWIEEAQTLSDRSLTLLRPTIRAPGSEIWASWNPRRKADPIDKLFRGPELPTNAVVVKANWADNPWLPPELNQERQDCLRMNPDQYDHIWEGAYASITEGAYFARQLAEARRQGRIGRVAPDPLMTFWAIWDIGGTGAKADACAIWVAQFIGRELRVVDYYEATGQPLATHVGWLRERGYRHAECILPHDGATYDRVHRVSFQSALKEAGFSVRVIPNQGAGAAKARIECARRLFPNIWFNAATCEAGLEALGAYHEKRDDDRQIGLGPEHDWACITPDTEVLTRYGTQPICDLPPTGEIMTPCGFRQYTNPHKTKSNAQLVEVRFEGGHTVRCTPDHLCLTAGGWKYAGLLRRGSLIRSCLTQRHSTLMAVSIAFGLANATLVGVVRSCTETYGKGLSALFLRAAIFITEMVRWATTPWLISNAFPQASICGARGTSQRRGLHLGSTLRKPLAAKRLSGMARRLVANGTDAMLSGPKGGRSGSENQGIVQNAALDLTHWSERAGTPRYFAVRPARWLRIESVRRLSERSDVWCLTVPDVGCFSLANGAVVHNSHGADAFGLMCVAYEAPYEDEDEERWQNGKPEGVGGY